MKRQGKPRPEKVKRKISGTLQEHGVYAAIARLRKGQKALDLRTRAGKLIQRTVDELVDALGGPTNISPLQRVIVDRVKEKLLIMHLINQHLVSLKGEITTKDGRLIPILGENYLRWGAELRRDLEALQRLGMKKSATLDYEKYINELERVGGQSEKKK